MEPEDVRRLKQLGKNLFNLVVYGKDLEAEEETRKQGREYAQWVQRLCEDPPRNEEQDG